MTQRGILVVGGDSMVGRHVAGHLRRQGWPVDATTRRTADGDAGRPRLDLADGSGFALADHGYEAAVICAARARLADCADDPDGSRRVNVTGTVELARRLVAAGTRVLFLSTDKVFDGTVPHRPAEDPPCPTSEYGRQKAEAEAAILRLPGCAVLRLSKIIHPGMALFDGWAKSLRSGQPITPFADMAVAPVPVAVVATVVERILRQMAEGIFQLTAPDDVTYADLAQVLAREIGADPALVRPIRGAVSTALGGEPPSRHTALDIGRVRRGLGIEPPDAATAMLQVLKGA